MAPDIPPRKQPSHSFHSTPLLHRLSATVAQFFPICVHSVVFQTSWQPALKPVSSPLRRLYYQYLRYCALRSTTRIPMHYELACGVSYERTNRSLSARQILRSSRRLYGSLSPPNSSKCSLFPPPSPSFPLSDLHSLNNCCLWPNKSVTEPRS